MTLSSTTGDDLIMGTDGDEILDGGAGNDTISLDLGNDTLIGGEGIDTIDASETTAGVTIQIGGSDGTVLNVSGDEVGTDVVPNVDFENVIGGSGDDFIFGNALVNDLAGGLGDDTIHSFGGADTIDGGEGSDTALFTAGGAVEVDLDDDGNATSSLGDTLIGIENINGSAAGDDSLSGNDGPNQLFGNGGNDTLDGEGGADTLIGGDGDDLIISDAIDTVFGGNEIDLEDPAADLITDDGGVDTIDLAGLNEGIFIDLDLNTPGETNTQEGAIFDAQGGTLLADVIDVENAIGTQGNDTLFGNNEVNSLSGGAGDDAIHSFGGADTLDGGEGTDTALFTAGGAVEVDLDENGDAVSSFDDQLFAFENINGSAAGDDRLAGNDRSNQLFGNGGNDTLDGEGDADTLIGGDGDDLIVSDAIDTVFGGNEIDLEDPDADLITDDGGIDTIDFSTLEEGVADFGPFDGVIVDLDVNSAGPAGTPSQEGGILNAPPGAVAIEGVVPAENILQSVIDVENAIGSDFNDGLFGNNEVNILQGGAGNDAIHGFAGDDFLAGGAGTDTVLFAAAPVGVIVDLNDQVSEEDFAAIAAGELEAIFAATGGAGNNVLSGFENVTGGSGDDDITGDDNDNILTGNGGSNILNGGAGTDTAVFSGNQADFEIAQADDGVVTVANLAAGFTDTLTDIEILSFADGDVTVADLFGEVEVDVVIGTDGADIIIGGLDIDAVEDIILTGADDDTIDLPLATVEAANNIVLAGSGADQIFVSSGDIVSGGSGNDILDATDSSGGNRLSGGAGNDTLILGVAGGDRFLGGAGDDTFLFGEGGAGGNILVGGSGADIFALSPGEVAIEANLITDFDLAEDAFAGVELADVTFDGSDVLVGDDVVATLLGVDATMLTEANFV